MMEGNWGQQQPWPSSEGGPPSIQYSYQIDEQQQHHHHSQQGSQGVPANATVPSQAAKLGTHQTPSNVGTSGAATATAVTAPALTGASNRRPIRRRMRMITSCLECRRRKLKCDKNQPCSGCSKLGRECVYLGPQLDEVSQLRLTALKEKVGSLERQLERGASRSAQQQQQTQASHQPHGILADEVADEGDAGDGLRVTDMVAGDVTYEDDGVDDDIVDLGVKVGKMRITDRVGGMSRPRLSEEIRAGISSQLSPGQTGQNGPQGPPPGQQQASPGPSPGMNLASNPLMNFDFTTTSMDSWPQFLLPGDSYIPPSSNMMVPHSSNQSSLENFLPTRGAADRLVQQYFEAVHPIARAIHGPSFRASYEEFWYHVYQNIEPRASLQALVFAAMFSAAVSMGEAETATEFGRSHKNLYETLKLGAETALSKANFLRTTRVETLQAFVVYMIPLCRGEISRAHSVLVGAAVRMAECMGLHRDGQSTYGLNPLDTHVRRLIWHQLCFLDIRTCEAQGPRPSIRRDDYDTNLPLNCEEDQLDEPPPVDDTAPQKWTSSLLPLIRFEINEMMRILWIDRRKLEQKRTTLTAVLSKIETFRKRMLEKYDPCLASPNAVPIQRYARLVMNLLLYRLHAMILPLFQINSTGARLSPKLNRILVTSGIMILEIGIQLEADPAFRPWAWYAGAYHQFQIALLLATELYYRPDNPEKVRIWACLDYVFDTDRSLPPEAKGLRILGEIMQKTALYQKMRRSRAPGKTARAVAQQNAAAGKGEDTDTLPPHLERSRVQKPSQPQGIESSEVEGQMPRGPAPGPPPGAVYAGISDGQTLWSMPAPLFNDGTGHNPDPRAGAASGVGAPSLGTSGAQIPSNVDVDWDVMNGLFMADPKTGELNISGYGDPSLGINWQYWNQGP